MTLLVAVTLTLRLIVFGLVGCSDFDLEAKIHALPPCSLEVMKRRQPRKRCDSEGKKAASSLAGSSSPTHCKLFCGKGPF
jgi:hypothetical protein